MPTGIWYCTRESVKTALDELETARSNDAVDAACEQGAVDVDGFCLALPQGLAPYAATKTFDYPARNGRPAGYRVWFDGQRCISATSVTVAGGATTLDPSEYILEPRNDGPPYNRLEVDLSTSASLASGGTFQRAIAVTGLWGLDNITRRVGSLAGDLAADADATASLSWLTARIGVGTVLQIDDERMTIVERSFIDSGQDLTADLDADDAAVQVRVSSGAAFAVEEIISIDGERMRVVEVVGNTLTVRRAWDGSQLAAHTSGDEVYALTGVQLERAVLGTTLAAHTSGATVYAWVPNGLLAELNTAYAINSLLQHRAGFARVAGTGENAREFTGRGIAAIEADIMAAGFVPRARVRSIT